MVKIVGNYTLTQAIGQGQYGKVYKATHMETKVDVAIKSIPILRLQDTPKLIEGMKNQVDILKLAQDNPHVIKFIELIKTSKNVYMVYQYCQGGTLDAYIRKHKSISETQCLLLMRQLMIAFKHLTTYSIYHRDIKPDNILIKDGKLKLADFGFCKKMGSLDDLTQTVLGSPVYMPPELLNGDLYNSKADIWSLGVVFYQMLFGTPPFSQGSLSDLVKHMENFELKLPHNAQISYETENLLRRMLTKQHFRRISWEDLFFEYEISESGVLSHREKGFQYDLMKLMKKNSSKQSPLLPPPKRNSNIKWDTITDRKSSILSEELESYYKGCDIDKLLQTKKQVKDLFLIHSKCYQASSTMSQILRKKYSKQSEALSYYISTIIKNNLQNLQYLINEFKRKNSQFLDSNPQDADKLRKLQFILVDQNPLLSKINKLRLSLLSISDQYLSMNQNTVKRYLRNYTDSIKSKYPNCESFDDSELNKDITVHLIKVLSAINFTKQKQVVNINQAMPKIKLSKMLHKRRRDLDI